MTSKSWLPPKSNNPKFSVGIHQVTMPMPLPKAVRELQYDISRYANYGRIIDMKVDSERYSVWGRPTYVYTSTLTYEIYY